MLRACPFPSLSPTAACASPGNFFLVNSFFTPLTSSHHTMTDAAFEGRLPLAGAVIVVTGELRARLPRAAFKAFAALGGGTLGASVTRNTTHLVVGHEPQPSRIAAAEAINAAYGGRGYGRHDGHCAIMWEDEFFAAFEGATAAALGLSVGAMWRLALGGANEDDPLPSAAALQAREGLASGSGSSGGCSKPDDAYGAADDDCCSLYGGRSRAVMRTLLDLQAMGAAATAAPRVDSFSGGGKGRSGGRGGRRRRADDEGDEDDDDDDDDGVEELLDDDDDDEGGGSGKARSRRRGIKRAAPSPPPAPPAKRSKGAASSSSAPAAADPAPAPSSRPTSSPSIRGAVVVVTGEIDTMTREQFRGWLLRRGAALGGSVGPATTHLVIARKPGRSKITAAAKQNAGPRSSGLPPIAVLNQTQFFTTYGE